MNKKLTRCAPFLFFLGVASSSWAAEPRLFRSIDEFVSQRESEFDQIPADRKEQLSRIASYIKSQRASGQPARLTFICTHNSRRSHLSQLWAAVAALHYGIDSVETYSGGTESTAFNPRAVAAMKRVGFEIEVPKVTDNPKYRVHFAKGVEPQICFSKVYSQAPNPKQDYCAIMTCSSADKNCPVVSGASVRIAVPYEDPKVADGTPAEAATYDERAAQIAREILFAFSLVR